MSFVKVVDVLENQNDEIELKNVIVLYVRLHLEKRLSRYAQLLVEIFI